MDACRVAGDTPKSAAICVMVGTQIVLVICPQAVSTTTTNNTQNILRRFICCCIYRLLRLPHRGQTTFTRHHSRRRHPGCLCGNNGKWEEPRFEPVCNTLSLVTGQDSMVMQVARGNVVINCDLGNGAGKNSMFYAMARAGGHGRRPYNLVDGLY